MNGIVLVKGMPKVTLAVGLVAGHAETVLVCGEVALRGRAIPVRKVVVVRAGVVGVVENVVAKVVGENVIDIVLRAGSLVITRIGMVWLCSLSARLDV